MVHRIIAAIAALLLGLTGVAAQTIGLPIVPLRYCQYASPSAATSLSAGVCASFTGTGSGTNLTASSVTGKILVGDTVTGTGVPANTTILSQTSGTTGGAGVYVTSAATTSSGAALTSGSIPPGANVAYITVSAQSVRYRDDGSAPTATVGVLLPVTSAGLPFVYLGTLSAFQMIQTTTNATVDVAFYRSP